jgi:hypothetical protein
MLDDKDKGRDDTLARMQLSSLQLYGKTEVLKKTIMTSE